MKSINTLIKRYPLAVFQAIVWSTFFFGYTMFVRSGSDMWQLLVLGTFLGGAVVTGIVDG